MLDIKSLNPQELNDTQAPDGNIIIYCDWVRHLLCIAHHDRRWVAPKYCPLKLNNHWHLFSGKLVTFKNNFVIPGDTL